MREGKRVGGRGKIGRTRRDARPLQKEKPIELRSGYWGKVPCAVHCCPSQTFRKQAHALRQKHGVP